MFLVLIDKRMTVQVNFLRKLPDVFQASGMVIMTMGKHYRINLFQINVHFLRIDDEGI